ncbi:dienelactone hydrolase family protein [Poritiphilus flavus]|uniref:Dienelactone hydrolase domain-containing protein n=1 Tax=Poritiphilus flavus TaxID=2697053 RepID=A0A6L9EIM6_9FLAO|nr:prolyl oligopeptidase family serine peptidase [Poritiphilus flavus]NAS14039.1 hypothetical protein [Poritiphilus flavus]
MRLKNGALLVYSILLLFLFGCSESFLETDDDPANVIPELSIEDVNRAFSELSFNTGVNDFTLNVLHNQSWDFRVIVPEVEEGELLPLFVNLHGGVLTPDANAHKRTECLIEPALENTRAYVISPNSQARLWNHNENVSQVLNLVDFAIEHLSVDPQRVVAVGYSDGGTGSWFFADLFPEVFSAGIPMASFYGLSYTEEGLVKKTDVPLYVIHGEDDTIFPYTNTETLAQLSMNAGSDITLIKAVGLTHFVPCEYLSYLLDAIDWLKTEVWE